MHPEDAKLMGELEVTENTTHQDTPIGVPVSLPLKKEHLDNLK